MPVSGFDYASFYADLDEFGYHRTNTSSNELVFLPLLQQLGLARGAAVASLGCGTCAALPRLRSDLEQADVYGMEVSPKVLDIARQLGRDGPCSSAPCLRRGSLTQLPWPNDGLDVAISSDVLEHLHPHDVGRTVSELSRVVRGKLLLSIASGSSFKTTRSGKRVDLHLTQRSATWWVAQFSAGGWSAADIPVRLWASLWNGCPGCNRPQSHRRDERSCPWQWRGQVCDALAQTDCGNIFFAFGKTAIDRLELERAGARVLRKLNGNASGTGTRRGAPSSGTTAHLSGVRDLWPKVVGIVDAPSQTGVTEKTPVREQKGKPGLRPGLRSILCALK